MDLSVRGDVMRGSLFRLSALVAIGLLLAGCSNSTTPDRAAAAFESTQPAPNGDLESTSEDSSAEELSVSEQPEISDDSMASEEPVASESGSTEKFMGSKLCIVNNSTESVVITTVDVSRKILGEIAQGDEQCQDNFNAFGSKDLARGISVKGVYLMSVTMNNPFIGRAEVILYQSGNQVCPVNDLAGPGKLGGAKDDGVLRYQLMRVTPYSLKPQEIEFKLVLSDSENPTSSGRPVACV